MSALTDSGRSISQYQAKFEVSKRPGAATHLIEITSEGRWVYDHAKMNTPKFLW